MLNMKQI